MKEPFRLYRRRDRWTCVLDPPRRTRRVPGTEWLSVSAVAKWLACPPSLVRLLARAGRLPYVTDRPQLRFEEGAVRAWITQHRLVGRRVSDLLSPHEPHS